MAATAVQDRWPQACAPTDIIGRHHGAVAHLPSALRGSEPLFGGEIWKLAAGQPPENLGAFREAARLHHFTDITPDAHKSLWLDHRSDVVQYDAGDRGRVRHRKVHGEQSAARAADEDSRADRERGEHGDDISELDQKVVILRIAVVFGLAAPARVDRKNAARAGIG